MGLKPNVYTGFRNPSTEVDGNIKSGVQNLKVYRNIKLDVSKFKVDGNNIWDKSINLIGDTFKKLCLIDF